MRVRFWKKKKKINEAVDPVPSKYPQKVKSYLTIYYPGGGSKEIKVDEISNETIRDMRKGEYYTGVPPDIQDRRFKLRWRSIRMHHALHGIPFTFQISSGKVISDPKKNSRLIEQGRGVAVEFDNRSIVVLVDLESQEPIWREEQEDVVKFKAEDEKLDWQTLKKWIVTNKDKLDDLEYLEFPVLTAFDVSEIEFLRAEFAALIESKAIEKTLLSMESLGKEGSVMWYFIGALVFGAFIILVMMYFANEGVFDKRDTALIFRRFFGW